ncbi:hypothetical protein AgCh_003640 [Apium graveolens]
MEETPSFQAEHLAILPAFQVKNLAATSQSFFEIRICAFLSPSPDCAEFGKSGLKWLFLEGVELFLPPVWIALSSANQE